MESSWLYKIEINIKTNIQRKYNYLINTNILLLYYYYLFIFF